MPGVEPHWVIACGADGPAAAVVLSAIGCGRGMRSFSRPRPAAPRAWIRRIASSRFGDGGANTPEQKAIAYRAFQEKPDFVMIPGDIVYARGRVSEYRDKFWPVYNADQASPSVGAPLLALDPVPRRAGQPRHRDSRPGEVPRRPGLLPLLGAAAERTAR